MSNECRAQGTRHGPRFPNGALEFVDDESQTRERNRVCAEKLKDIFLVSS